MHQKNYQNGFTLIELSIVLVIIGLIVAGIVGGRALVHQAELNKIIGDLNGYKTAYNAYSMQYDAIPGDHATATQYWPGKTNDGNGDGMIWDADAGNGTARFEDQKAFEHLALADLIPFKPQNYAGSGGYVIGVHVPSGPVKGQGYRFESAPWCCGGQGYVYGRRGARLIAGTIGTYDLYNPFLKPADARNIDTKMDDGFPASGQVMADDITNGTCVQGKTGTANANPGNKGSNKYNVGNAAPDCNVMYWMN